ncbi:MAG: hypothetical protein A3F91_08620 [Flavobacteria bacterium RIFCSPLOWO2_12_FULL_35_11]|nr:MAG: hypothetical protein A3F91_08620 [Flavobacteria bacterium RIFCSPLOWO2_12_FULL_35_11]
MAIKIYGFYGLIFLLISACSKQSDIAKKMNCSLTNYKNTKQITDFNKNFILKIPSNWKTELYFDNYQSEIITADTIKQLSDTFILSASFDMGTLNFDSDFHRRKDSALKANNLKIIDFGSQTFQSKPSFWYVAKGTKNNFAYHRFTVLTKISENTYFSAYSEIYGNSNINERICESISLLESIQFLE